eukprot:sb/3462384/
MENRKRSYNDDEGSQFPRKESRTEKVIKILCPYYCTGAVIGTKGANIDRIKSESGTNIQVSKGQARFPKTDERVVAISGNYEGHLKVIEFVNNLVRTEKPSSQARNVDLQKVELRRTVCKLIVSEQSVGRLIGKAGANVSRLISEHGVNVKIWKQGDAVEGLIERIVEIDGKDENVDNCIREVVKDVFEDERGGLDYNLDYNQFGYFEGGYDPERGAAAAGGGGGGWYKGRKPGGFRGRRGGYQGGGRVGYQGGSSYGDRSGGYGGGNYGNQSDRYGDQGGNYGNYGNQSSNYGNQGATTYGYQSGGNYGNQSSNYGNQGATTYGYQSGGNYGNQSSNYGNQGATTYGYQSGGNYGNQSSSYGNSNYGDTTYDNQGAGSGLMENRKRSYNDDEGSQFPRKESRTEKVIKILCPYYCTGAVIGTKGANIDRIKSESGTNIQVSKGQARFPKTDERVVAISGNYEGHLKVIEFVNNLVRTEKPSSQARNVDLQKVELRRTVCKLIVSEQSVGRLIGKAGANVSRLISEHGVNVKIWKQGDAVEGLIERIVEIDGKDENVDNCIREVVKDVFEDERGGLDYNLDYNQFGYFEGGYDPERGAAAAGGGGGGWYKGRKPGGFRGRRGGYQGGGRVGYQGGSSYGDRSGGYGGGNYGNQSDRYGDQGGNYGNYGNQSSNYGDQGGTTYGYQSGGNYGNQSSSYGNSNYGDTTYDNQGAGSGYQGSGYGGGSSGYSNSNQSGYYSGYNAYNAGGQ